MIRFTAPFARLVGTVIDGVNAAVGVYDDWRWARFDRRRVREAQASARAAHPTARQAAER